MSLSSSLSRRALLGGLIAAPAIANLSWPALARAPLANKAVPSIYRVKVGSIEVTAVQDGSINLPSSLILADKAAVEGALAAASMPNPNPTTIMTYLVNTGDKLVLIDTGYGPEPGSGRLLQNLAAAGVAPGEVDILAMTHAHPDHINGAYGADGKATFPNAEMVIAEAETKFWSDDGYRNQAPKDSQIFFDLARKGYAPYAARTRRFGAKADIAPGITAEAAPGHTPGHTMYRISSGNRQLLIFGDIVHSAALQFAHPEWSIAFDADPALAGQTRKRVFDMLAADGVEFAGAHLPFPALGRLVREGAAYRYVPSNWQQDL